MVLPEPQVKALADAVAADPQANQVTLDLTQRELKGPDGVVNVITLGDEERDQLLSGLDPISRTLQEYVAKIDEFEVGDRGRMPWMYS